MRLLEKLPIVRIAYRQFHEITRPAPLLEFEDYDAYWKSRINDGLTARILDRHIVIEKSIPDGESVLDIGCGDGTFLRYLKKVSPLAKYWELMHRQQQSIT